MTPQEEQLIDGLVGRIRNTSVQSKDMEAEEHIQQQLAGVPDALYVLVQTVLVQQYGLERAQSQIGELKQQIQALQTNAAQAQKSSSGSFLSHIFGGGSSSTPPPPASGYQRVNNPGYGSQGQGGYPPPPPPVSSQGSYPGYSSGGMFGGGSGGFLQSALQTAAGVAAGEMVFQGMEDLFHGFGHEGSSRSFSGGRGETVVNNYYDQDSDRLDRSIQGNDQDFYNPSDDASRQDPGSADSGSSRFADGGSGNDILAGDTGDTGSYDDTLMGNDSLDDSGSDDFSSDNS